jgi:EmrB/QacA subfamily drug resistance transporter
VRLDSAAGRWLVAAMVLGTGMAFLDGSIVNLALPAIDDDLDAGVAGLQWTVNAYTLALAALILVGGSLGDRWGRRRVFVVGVTWFGLASVACALAPTIEVLVAARGLQGVGGALLTPGSLAIISASIHPEDRGRAIGLWSGLAGVTTALGPFVGGTLVDAVGWRSVFWVNVPLAVAVVVVTLRHVPETRGAQERLDVEGALLTVGTLALLTYGLVEEQWPPALGGVALLVAFVVHQARSPHALVPLSLFTDRVFTAANICTFAIYAALSGTMFLLVLQLQYVAGYTPLEAGLATLPLTVLMLLLSSKAGELGQRIGPRLPMTVGPLLAAAGLVLYLRIGEDASFWVDVLPRVGAHGPRHHAARRAADHRGARGGARRPGRHRVGHQQRRLPHRRPAGRGRHPALGRHLGRRLRLARGLRARVPCRDLDVRRPARGGGRLCRGPRARALGRPRARAVDRLTRAT